MLEMLAKIEEEVGQIQAAQLAVLVMIAIDTVELNFAELNVAFQVVGHLLLMLLAAVLFAGLYNTWASIEGVAVE